MATIEISRADVSWEGGLNIGGMSFVGTEVTAAAMERGATTPEVIRTIARKLAVIEPPLLSGDNEFYMAGVEEGIAAAGLTEGDRK